MSSLACATIAASPTHEFHVSTSPRSTRSSNACTASCSFERSSPRCARSNARPAAFERPIASGKRFAYSLASASSKPPPSSESRTPGNWDLCAWYTSSRHQGRVKRPRVSMKTMTSDACSPSLMISRRSRSELCRGGARGVYRQRVSCGGQYSA